MSEKIMDIIIFVCLISFIFGMPLISSMVNDSGIVLQDVTDFCNSNDMTYEYDISTNDFGHGDIGNGCFEINGKYKTGHQIRGGYDSLYFTEYEKTIYLMGRKEQGDK